MEQELRKLLEEVLRELASCFRPVCEDDEDWWESICERAEKLGINV